MSISFKGGLTTTFLGFILIMTIKIGVYAAPGRLSSTSSNTVMMMGGVAPMMTTTTLPAVVPTMLNFAAGLTITMPTLVLKRAGLSQQFPTKTMETYSSGTILITPIGSSNTPPPVITTSKNLSPMEQPTSIPIDYVHPDHPVALGEVVPDSFFSRLQKTLDSFSKPLWPMLVQGISTIIAQVLGSSIQFAGMVVAAAIGVGYFLHRRQ